MDGINDWASRVFGDAELGDVRRTRRLVRMAGRAAESPAGEVTRVFSDAAERQAAYDLLEHHDMVPARAVSEALFDSTARACGDLKRVLVAVDGTSLTLTERSARKGFGSLGSRPRQSRGLKLINAIALDEAGTHIGVAQQQWWVRQSPATKTRRAPHQRESRHWRECLDGITKRFGRLAPNTRLHVVADREADSTLFIQKLVDDGVEFTVRSSAFRKIMHGGQTRDMRESLRRCRVLATTTVKLPATAARSARVARLSVRAAKVPIRLREKYTRTCRVEELTVVWVRERGRVPKSGRVEWLLLTNVMVSSAADALAVVRRYSMRWKIELFHRTWKSGLCNVERTQLRSVEAVVKWASVLAAVASRAQHLRTLAREQPDAPADQILSATEIEALVLLKSRFKRRNQEVSAKGLTVATAVRWIADLGGYVGNKSSGKPGAITIGRGLDKLEPAVELIEHLRETGQLR